jgi:hypothetical protein
MIKLLNILKESTNPSVYKVVGKLIINTKERSLSDILSDIRAIAGVTIVQTRNIEDDVDPRSKRHRVTLSIKMDPAPFKPFNRSSFRYILNQIKKIPSVLDAKFESEPVSVPVS